MNRKGVEFTLLQVEPGLWKWQFQIGETVTTGKTQTHLLGRAAHSAQKRIDLELSKGDAAWQPRDNYLDRRARPV